MVTKVVAMGWPDIWRSIKVTGSGSEATQAEPGLFLGESRKKFYEGAVKQMSPSVAYSAFWGQIFANNSSSGCPICIIPFRRCSARRDASDEHQKFNVASPGADIIKITYSHITGKVHIRFTSRWR